MQIRGIVRTATLEENPPDSDQIEMILRVQGVGAGQPRLLVVPYALLLADPELEPEQIQGKGFQAEVADEGPGVGSSARSPLPRGGSFAVPRSPERPRRLPSSRGQR